MISGARERRLRKCGAVACGSFSAMLFGLALGVMIVGGSARAADPEGVTIEVRGVRVVGEGYGEGMGGVRAFNWSKGTSVGVLVVFPEGGLIAFNRDASSLDKMADDKGTDLKVRDRFGESGFGMMPGISEDGKACMVEISGKGVPAKGAQEIAASGTLVFTCGSKKETFKKENVLLKVGTKVQAGKIPFEISKVGEPDWGEEPLQITLKTNKDCSAISEIKFLDAAGKEIRSSEAGTTSMSGMGMTQVERSFNLAEKAETVTVAITYWMDMAEKKVPFDVKAGLGL